LDSLTALFAARTAAEAAVDVARGLLPLLPPPPPLGREDPLGIPNVFRSLRFRAHNLLSEQQVAHCLS